MPTTDAPAASEWQEDLADAPMDDPTTEDAGRWAGCSVSDEIRQMEVGTI